MAFMDPQTIYLESKDIRIDPAFERNNIPLCLFSSNAYAPYCGVLIHSVIQNSSIENNYDIIVMERDISSNNKRLMLSLIKGKENFSIRFINLAELSKQISASVHGHFALEGSLKLYLLTDIFSAYDKFVTTDSDLVFNRDVAELYAVDVDNVYMAAVDDVIMKQLVADKHISGSNSKAPKMPSGDYIADYLGMGSSDIYYNTGVVVFNLKHCRENQLFEKALEKLNSKHYWFIEQDVLNEICGKQVALLDLKWNVLSGNTGLARIKQVLSADLYEKFMDSLDDYYIMHFAGNHKPWLEPGLEYSERFFAYARTSPWYEQIVFSMNGKYAVRVAQNTVNKFAAKSQVVKKRSNWIQRIKKKLYGVVYPIGTKRREQKDAVSSRKKDNALLMARREMKQRIKDMRKQSQYKENYQQLKALKNKYAGQRCFIIGNGPSLTLTDLDAIKSEITFGMNSIYKLFPETDWRPTFYVTNDVMLSYKMKVSQEKRKEDLLACLKEYTFEQCLVSSSKYNDEIKKIYKGELTFLPTEDYLYQIRQPRFPKVPKNCAKRCQAFGTTAFLIYQLAVYMGFSEIYFLGTDCDYTSGKVHAYEDDKVDRNLYADAVVARNLELALLRGFSAINRDAFARPDVKVFNATRGGKLEIFPRVDLETVMKETVIK